MRSLIRCAAGAAVTTACVASLLGASRFRHMQAPAQRDSAEVVQTVTNYHKALTSGDSLTALTLLATDAVILESGGMETRSEYRSHHLPGDIAFARAVKSVRSPLKVVVAGSTAWTFGTSTAQGEFNGRPINSLGAESMVLTRTPNGWRIRSIHWSSRNRRPPAAK